MFLYSNRFTVWGTLLWLAFVPAIIEGSEGMFHWHNVCLVMLGGGLGAVSRYMVTTILGSRLGTVFPWGTCAVNVLGCFLIGAVMNIAIGNQRVLSESIRMLLVVGFLGGFTTFSSFGMETMNLLIGREFFWALSNAVLNLGLGLLAVWCGIMLTKLIL